MPLIWLRVALVCYAAGLLYLGMVFHLVSLTESAVQSGQLATVSIHNSESLLAFLIMVVFMLAYLIYKTTTPGIVIFPLVFLLTFIAATGQQPLVFASVAVKHGWLAVHDIGYRSLMVGFPFMTLGLIAGSVVAEATYGRIDFLDPKILLSVLMWAVYLLMVFTRLNAGWRGRRAAMLASAAFVTAIVAWIANYFSAMHRFIAS